MGKYGKGELNNNGQFLPDIAEKYNLLLSNTMFQHKAARRATWVCPDKAKTKSSKMCSNQIDYILIQNKFKSRLINSRSFGGLWTDTDHKLVIMFLKAEEKQKIKRQWNPHQKKKIDFEKLQNNEIALKFKTQIEEDISKVLQPIGNLDSDHDQSQALIEWKTIAEIEEKASKEILGYKSNKKKSCNPEIIELSIKQKKLKTQINSI